MKYYIKLFNFLSGSKKLVKSKKKQTTKCLVCGSKDENDLSGPILCKHRVPGKYCEHNLTMLKYHFILFQRLQEKIYENEYAYTDLVRFISNMERETIDEMFGHSSTIFSDENQFNKN